MAQSKPLSVPVSPGMRQDLSEHMSPPGTLTYAKNVRFPIQGEAQARGGTTALSTATSANVTYATTGTFGPDYLAAVPGGFVFGAQGFGYRYDAAQGRVHTQGSYANAMPEGVFATIASEELVYALGRNTPYPLSVAVGGGYIAICWSAGDGQEGAVGPPSAGPVVNWSKIQIFTTDGTLVLTVAEQYTAAWVLYDPVTAGFIIVAQHNGSGLIDAAIVAVSATGATLGAFVNIATMTSGVSYWAACAWTGIGWAIVYQSAATTVTIQKMVGTTISATQTFANTGIQPLSVYCDATNLYAGWVDVGADNNSRYRAYGTTLVLAGGTVTLKTEIGIAFLALTPPLFGTTVAVAPCAYAVVGKSSARTSTSTAGNDTYMQPFLVHAGGVTTTGTLTYNLFPASAPFNSGMIWALMRTPNASDNGNDYKRSVLVDYQADRFTSSDTNVILKNPRIALVGEAFADIGSGDYLGGSYFMHLCCPQLVSSDVDGVKWIAPIPRMVRCEQFTGSVSWGLVIGEWLKFKTWAWRQVCALGKEAIVPGSPVLTGKSRNGTFLGTGNYNQADGTDLGFFGQPSVSCNTVQSNTADGALTLLGLYQYRVVIEWIDGDSKRWRSAPSRVYSVQLTGANDTVTHQFDYTFSWMRQNQLIGGPSGVVRHIYRTVANGSTFYRCTPPQGTMLASDGIATTHTDTMNDGQLSTREILYTDGGVLDNDHPASCEFVRATEDRVWLAGLWDRTQLQSSKILVPGEPPQFSDSPAFRAVIPVDCTGLAIQDGVVVAFGASSIYAIQGAGPNDQGQGSWDSPRCITKSTGCVNAQSILETSSGTFFESDRGIELLPRGMGEPIFIGAGVQDLSTQLLGVSNIPVVTSAAVITSQESRTARFCIGLSKYVLVYDLDANAWGFDEYPYEVVAICDTEAGAVLARLDASGGFGFLLEDGTATRDSVGNGPVEISSDVIWSWVRPFGLAGWGKFVGAIGMFDSGAAYRSGNATLFLTVDTATEPGQAFDMAGLASPDYRRRVPQFDAGTAAQLRLTTAAGGWRFMGWTLELEEIGGGRRMPETEQG